MAALFAPEFAGEPRVPTGTSLQLLRAEALRSPAMGLREPFGQTAPCCQKGCECGPQRKQEVQEDWSRAKYDFCLRGLRP